MIDWHIVTERLNEAYPKLRKWLDMHEHEKIIISQKWETSFFEDILKRLEKLEKEL